MPTPSATFIDALLSGHATAADIYDYVEAWHANGGKLPLHTHLGMTEAEYARWALEPSELSAIVAARRTGYDAVTGLQVKPPVRGRRLDV